MAAEGPVFRVARMGATGHQSMLSRRVRRVADPDHVRARQRAKVNFVMVPVALAGLALLLAGTPPVVVDETAATRASRHLLPPSRPVPRVADAGLAGLQVDDVSAMLQQDAAERARQVVSRQPGPAVTGVLFHSRRLDPGVTSPHQGVAGSWAFGVEARPLALEARSMAMVMSEPAPSLASMGTAGGTARGITDRRSPIVAAGAAIGGGGRVASLATAGFMKRVSLAVARTVSR